jgi:hypothetical protein
VSLESLTPEERSQLELARLLLSDPKTNKEARRLAKKLKPELQFADIELEDRLAAQRDESNEVTKALRADLEKEKFDRAREKAHERIRERGLDPVAVEKVMTENGIANYDLAMEILEARSQSAAPTPNDLEVMELPKGEEGGVDLWKDPKGFAQRTALSVLNGFRRQRVGAR